MEIQLCTDAKDLFDAVRCMKDNRGADQSMSIWVTALQEQLQLREIRQLIWVDTRSMLADATTKWMKDELIQWWYRTGTWEPNEFLSFVHHKDRDDEDEAAVCHARWNCGLCMRHNETPLRDEWTVQELLVM